MVKKVRLAVVPCNGCSANVFRHSSLTHAFDRASTAVRTSYAGLLPKGPVTMTVDDRIWR